MLYELLCTSATIASIFLPLYLLLHVMATPRKMGPPLVKENGDRLYRICEVTINHETEFYAQVRCHRGWLTLGSVYVGALLENYCHPRGFSTFENCRDAIPGHKAWVGVMLHGDVRHHKVIEHV